MGVEGRGKGVKEGRKKNDKLFPLKIILKYPPKLTLSIFAFVEFGSFSAFSSACCAFSASSLAFSKCFLD